MPARAAPPACELLCDSLAPPHAAAAAATHTAHIHFICTSSPDWCRRLATHFDATVRIIEAGARKNRLAANSSVDIRQSSRQTRAFHSPLEPLNRLRRSLVMRRGGMGAQLPR